MDAAAGLPWGAEIAFAALIGAVIGSFIATLVLRWPAGRSLAGRSQCDGCNAPLGTRDLVPLASALWLRGRCRRCGVPIDKFHSRVELASALLGALALALMPGAQGWLWALFGWLLLPLALLDARHMWLPDPLNALLALAGLIFAGPLIGTDLFERWIGALAGGLTLALIAWTWRCVHRREGMGGGDPKLVAALGAWLGWQALPLLLLLASLAGIGWALFSRGKGDQPLALRRVPFGVFLCAAAFALVPLWPWWAQLTAR
ncbi:prepilin peptidase [Sphingopyxis flava]|uniref:Prepilin leader peptidase/N-methyltransferase n=1 Tax=Sphingopyxis flava TaxID=1507287 RepID=A0A1T5A5Z8_9SPHN|nr:A24 family peptidase [Sphingopyxis flava]SKB30177.1 type 4 prepilin peptidase 1 Aspartic peptidase. MEROPS family A24A [Sphingopyxis flava]